MWSTPRLFPVMALRIVDMAVLHRDRETAQRLNTVKLGLVTNSLK
jgi:hypothetical protein